MTYALMHVNIFFRSFNEYLSVRLLKHVFKIILLIVHSNQNEIADVVYGVINKQARFLLSAKYLIKEGFWFCKCG